MSRMLATWPLTVVTAVVEGVVAPPVTVVVVEVVMVEVVKAEGKVTFRDLVAAVEADTVNLMAALAKEPAEVTFRVALSVVVCAVMAVMAVSATAVVSTEVATEYWGVADAEAGVATQSEMVMAPAAVVGAVEAMVQVVTEPEVATAEPAPMAVAPRAPEMEVEMQSLKLKPVGEVKDTVVTAVVAEGVIVQTRVLLTRLV